MGGICTKENGCGKTLSGAMSRCSFVARDPKATGNDLQASALAVASFMTDARRGLSFSDFYEKFETISYGASSTVFHSLERATGEHVAVKAIPKFNSGGGIPICSSVTTFRSNHRLRQKILAEVGAMQVVSGHENACRLRDFFEDERAFYLVMDYYSGGELFDHIVRTNASGFTERQAAGIMRDLFAFLAFCHSKGLVHADLKPENIVLSSAAPDAKIKVLDFGRSFFARADEGCRNVFGTVNYCSPEMARDDATGQKTDVWSAGVLLYFMLSGKAPFRYRNKEATLTRLRQAPKVAFTDEVWERVSPEAKDFIRALLTPDPNARPDAKAALEMAWLRDPEVSTRSAYMLGPRAVESLQCFSQRSRLCRVMLEVIARELPKEEIEEQLGMFYEIDADSNGVLDFEELSSAVKQVHPDLDDEELRLVFAAMDVNNSGMIDTTEFVAATIPSLSREKRDALIVDSFWKLDRSGSGFIPKNELKETLAQEFVLDSKDDAEIDRELEELDVNGDGVISVEEFKCALNFECCGISVDPSQISCC